MCLIQNADLLPCLPSNIICKFLVEEKYIFKFSKSLLANGTVHVRRIQFKQKHNSGFKEVNLENICI